MYVPVTCNALLHFIIVLCYVHIYCSMYVYLMDDEVSPVPLCHVLFVVVDSSVLLYCVTAATWCLIFQAWGCGFRCMWSRSLLIFCI
jgi:hypothetical protein